MTRFRKIETRDIEFVDFETEVDLSNETFSGGVAIVTGIRIPSMLLVLSIAVTGDSLEDTDADTLTVQDAEGATIATIDLSAAPFTAKAGARVDPVRSALVVLAQETVSRGQSMSFGDIKNGGSAGMAQCGNAITTRGPTGVIAQKAASDDLWDLTGVTTNDADKVRAVALCLDDSGTATIIVGDQVTGTLDAAGIVAAIAEITQPTDKTVVGYHIGGNSKDYSAALETGGQFVEGNVAITYGDPVQAGSETTSLKLVFSGGSDNDPSAGTVTVRAAGIDVRS